MAPGCPNRHDGPVNAPAALARNPHLDRVRGVATLGILGMNSISFGLPVPAYWNVGYAGSDTPLDLAVGLLGEVFLDQKMMGLFSLLFGASLVLYLDRISTRSKRPVRRSLWRNALLLGMGMVHSAFWEGDVLLVYALCAPVVLLLRKLPPRLLLGLGLGTVGLSALLGFGLQEEVTASGATSLGWYWSEPEGRMPEAWELIVIGDFFLRAIGMMLVGVWALRRGWFESDAPARVLRRAASWGLGLGVLLAAAGALLAWSEDYAVTVAFDAAGLNTLATPLFTIGLLASILLWSRSQGSAAGEGLKERLGAVGRMALTNYISQTVLSLVVLRQVLEFGSLGRTELLLFTLAVGGLQLLWSPLWFRRFAMGPLEWLWRSVTDLRPARLLRA